MDIPTFRYMTDAESFLKNINKEVDESTQLMKKVQKMLASNFAGIRILAANPKAFDVSGDPDGQRALVKKLKNKIDPDLKNIVVPNMKKLEKQYAQAEEFYETLKGVEKAEAQIQMSFGTKRRGPEYEALMTQFRATKNKVAAALKECLQFLSDVASKHVPASFQKYIDDIATLINDQVIFRDSQTFMYVSTTPKGELVFTAYIMLQDVANDEGQVTPQLYVSIQWTVGEKPEVRVELNHEYEVPGKLLGQGEVVESVQDATKEIQHLLEMENYSTVLGVVPLALLMNVDPTSIKPSQFKAKDVIADMKTDEAKHTFTFVFTKALTNPEAITEVCASIYIDLKNMLKRNGAKIGMRPNLGAKPASVTFTVTKPSEGGEFNNYDWEYLRDKFGLNNTQLRKIGNVINQTKED